MPFAAKGDAYMDLDVKLFEQTINEILPNTGVHVRDVNLPKELAEKYVPYTIIKEIGFTDASKRVMGMKTSHRFAIISNHMGDLSAFEPDTNCGLMVARRNSHFIVLDNYEYHGKTLITLLHLPNDKRWKLFQNVRLDIYDDIIKETRERFENKCEQAVIPELATEEWLKRWSRPLGMDMQGNMFDLEVDLSTLCSNIRGESFRKFYHKIVFIKASPILRISLRERMDCCEYDNGCLAYGYINEREGLSFRILCSADVRFNKLTRRSFDPMRTLTLRRKAADDYRFLGLDYCDVDTSDFADYIAAMDERYKCAHEQTEKMREFKFLDSVRHPEYPDIVLVMLFKEGMQAEKVWVHCMAFSENELFGKLLTEPKQNFGIHPGNIIGFTPVPQKDGIMCISVGRAV